MGRNQQQFSKRGKFWLPGVVLKYFAVPNTVILNHSNFHLKAKFHSSVAPLFCEKAAELQGNCVVLDGALGAISWV